MRGRIWSALPLLTTVLLLQAAPGSAQGLAAIAGAATATVAVEKAGAGCWGCAGQSQIQYCIGGQVPGYWNCTVVFMGGCQASSPGCGGGAALPLDPDGSTQYVSRVSKLGIPMELTVGQEPVRRNCEGVVVARMQSPDDIAGVRTRTGLLTL